MSDIPVAQSWDALPPVVYTDPHAGSAVSTRKLEKDYRDAIDRIKELEAEITLTPLQAAQVAECLRGGSKELRETWATFLLTLPTPPIAENGNEG